MEIAFGGGGLVIGVIGIVLTIYYARRADASDRKRKRLEWADLQAAANDLSRRIAAKYAPVAIVTPGLRGATFANLLASDMPGQPPVYVGISTWKDDQHGDVLMDNAISIETQKWLVQIPSAVARYQTGPILLVDDFTMSGDFLHLLKGALIDAGVKPDQIVSASVAVTKVAVKNHKSPEYYWWLAEDDDFFFPWGKAR